MKRLLAALAIGAAFLGFGGSAAQAAPPAHNPQVVSYYEFGLHAIPLDPVIWLYGKDVVMKRGNSGTIQQWYIGEDIGYHSVWNLAKNGSCPANWFFIPNANPVGPETGWGHHLVEGAHYCVMTNSFAVGAGQ
jgi:hypothetical protein